jgi:nitric oxide reductase NorQ protein
MEGQTTLNGEPAQKDVPTFADRDRTGEQADETRAETPIQSVSDGGESDMQILARTLQDMMDGRGAGSDDLAGEGTDWFYIGDQLKVVQNPDDYLLSEVTGEYRGLTVYGDGHPSHVPSPSSFISGELSGSVSTKEEVIRVLKSTQKSPMLIGDAGTGKNTALGSVYASLGQNVFRVQVGIGMTEHDLIAEKDLHGGNTIVNLKSGGKAGVFGGAWLVDEINMADGNLTSFIHAAAEEVGKRSLSLPGTGVTLTDLPVTDAEIAAAGGDHRAAIREKWDPSAHLGRFLHPEFRVAATRNPPTYQGAHAMNDAAADRFSPIWFDYLDPDKEAKLLAEEVGTEVAGVKPLVDVVDTEIRSLRGNGTGGTRCPISYRRLADVVEYALGHGVSLYDGASEKLVHYAQNENDRHLLEDVLADNEHELSVVPKPAGQNPTQQVEYVTCAVGDCGFDQPVTDTPDGSRAHKGVCPDCENPSIDTVMR